MTQTTQAEPRNQACESTLARESIPESQNRTIYPVDDCRQTTDSGIADTGLTHCIHCEAVMPSMRKANEKV